MDSKQYREQKESLQETLRFIREFRETHKVKKESLEKINNAKLKARDNIRGLNKKHNLGRKMSSLGLALILCPDPFSDVVGVPLFVSGELVNRVYSSLTVDDVMKETKSIFGELSRVKSNLSNK